MNALSLASVRAIRSATAGSLTAGGISQIALVLSGIVVARTLGPEDRGYLALVLLIPGVLVYLGTLGLPLGATYYLAQFPQERGSIVRSLVAPACLQAVALVAIQAVVVSIVFAGEPSRVVIAGLVALAFTPVLVAQHYGLAVLQGERRFRAFNVLRTLPPTFYAAGVLCAVALSAPGLVEVMVIAVVTYASAAGLILVAVVRRLPPVSQGTPNVSRSRMLKFGLKGFLGSLSPVENFRLDHIAVAVFLNPIALGFYVVAQAFVNLPRFVAQSIGMVAYPSVAARSDPRAAQRSMWRYFVIGTVICFAAVALLEANVSWLVTFFFGTKFASAIPIAQILLLGAFFFGIRRVLADGARGAGRPVQGTVAEVASWLVTVPAVLLLGPRYGAEGIASALALSWAVGFLVLVAAVTPRPLGVGQATVIAFVALRRLAKLAPGALVLGIAIAAGLAVVLLPTQYVALAIVVPVGLALSAMSRKAFRDRLLEPRAGARGPAPARIVSPAVPDSADPRVARLLFFVGLALIGQLTLRPLPIATVSDWLFLGAFGAIAAFLIVHKLPVQITIPPLMVYGFFLFAIGAALSTFGSDDPMHSFSILLRLMFVTLVWAWLAMHVLQTHRHVMIAIMLWVGSAALTGAAALAQLAFGDVIPGGFIHWGRATGFTEGPNDLGGVTSIALIPALMLATLPRMRTFPSVLAFAALAMIGAGLVVSGSVTAFIAVLFGAFLWFAVLPRVPRRSLVVVAVVASGAAALLAFQQSNESLTPFERFARVTGSQDDSNATLWTRLETYRDAADRIASNPFVGVGLDPESAIVGDLEVHNFLISVWHRTGVLGIIGMVVLLLAIMKAGISALRSARSTKEQMSAHALLSAVVVYLVFGMGQPTLFSRYGWVAIVLLLSLRAVQIRELAQEERTARRGVMRVLPSAQLDAPGWKAPGWSA